MAWQPYKGDKYLEFPVVDRWCREAVEEFPHVIAREDIGQTRHNRPIFLLTLSTNLAEAHCRPSFWLDAGTHASEWTGTSTALYIVSHWLESLRNPQSPWFQWFEQHTAYVVPCISPDGYQALFEGYSYLRSTLRPPRTQGTRQGFDPGDVNRDGAVRLMRWKHPAGSFAIDEDIPMFMRPRKLSDAPEDAYFVSVEGEFLQWDGSRWYAAPREYALDLNRNFPAHWEPFDMFDMDSGTYPLSESESRSVVDAFQKRPYIGAAITLHTYTGCILTQPYREPSPLHDTDIRLMEALAQDAVEDTGYRVFRTYPDFAYDLKKPTVGVWSDTISTVFGIPGYTLELWDPYGAAGISIEKPAAFFAYPDPGITRALIQHFSQYPEAVTPWTPFLHPQLGAVEIGGLDYMRTIRNPPESQLAKECDKGYRIIKRVCSALPRVQIHTSTESLGHEITRLTVLFENLGFLPTSSLKRSETLGIVSETQVQLTLPPSLQCLDGSLEQRLGHLDGWGNLRIGPSRHLMHANLSPRGHRAFAQWILQGSGTITLHWQAGHAGHGSLSLHINTLPSP